jgi:aspartyl protease family protein
MSDYYGPSGGQMMRRAVLWSIGCAAAAVAVPRLMPADNGGDADAPPIPAHKPAKTPTAPAISTQQAISDGFTDSYRMGRDNQFFVSAVVNSATVPFVIDTGATLVSLTPDSARAAGLNPASLRYNIPVSTANGHTFHAAVTLRELRLGHVVEYEVPALVMQQNAFASLLGMSFLRRLKSWQINRGVLTIAY